MNDAALLDGGLALGGWFQHDDKNYPLAIFNGKEWMYTSFGKLQNPITTIDGRPNSMVHFTTHDESTATSRLWELNFDKLALKGTFEGIINDLIFLRG